jgi:uncharacterized protein
MNEAPESAEANNAPSDESIQGAIVAFLSHPGSYPGYSGDVDRIETHGALIFLAGERAYKLKRAVKLPYLDFSTLEKRRIAIEREFEINARTTPELYLSVIPVTRARAGFELAGSGEIADWLLVMRRFDQASLLDLVAARGQFGTSEAIELVHTIEQFHRHAPKVANVRFSETLARSARDLEAVLCNQEAEARGPDAKPCIGRLREELKARLPLLIEREREGFVRRCHGDLHLKNIVLWEGKPRLFDAIEFDDRLATIDVLYDLAFLLMDMWHRGLRQHANLVLNHYFQSAAISELSGLSLLPLFLSMRAAIRAMIGVHALAHQNAGEQEETLKGVETYVSVASALLSAARPKLIAIGGISGTGKSSVARAVAPLIGAAPGALHIRTDVERKLIQGVPLDKRLPKTAYAPEMRGEVYRRVLKKAEIALDNGHSVIVDAVFPEEAARTAVCELAQSTGAAFWAFWLEAGAPAVRERIMARKNDPSDADASIAEVQLRSIEPPDWIKIDASGTVEATTDAIIANLRDSR